MLRLLIAVALVFCSRVASARELVKELLSAAQETPVAEWVVASKPLDVTAPIPPDATLLKVQAKTGPGNVRVRMTPPKGNAFEISVKAISAKAYTAPALEFPDAALQVSGNVFCTLYIKPNATFYRAAERQKMLDQVESLPSASGTPFTLEVRKAGDAVEFWLNGQFLGERADTGFPTKVNVKLAQGAAMKECLALSPKETPLLVLPASDTAGPPKLETPELKVASDLPLLKQLGVASGPVADCISIADKGRLKCPGDDLVSFAWRRSALDRLPEAQMASVPLRHYSHAWLVCAAIDDGQPKVPSFTLRVTRYGSSRGVGFADSLVTLPETAAGATADAKVVGQIGYGPAGARKTAPLWLVRVPIDNGRIQDILEDTGLRSQNYSHHRYLEVELLDPLAGMEELRQFPPSLKPPGVGYAPGKDRSNVHVFGLAIETTPIRMVVRSNVVHRVFYASDNPAWEIHLQPRQPGKATLRWEFADVDGKIAASGEKTAELADPANATTVRVPIQVGNGWYAARIRLFDERGQELEDYRTTFVMLPPDTRQAGFDSPHGTWWFHWAHGGQPDLERVGPVMQRAGMRHTNLGPLLPESKTSEYGFTEWCVHWMRRNGKSMDEALEAHKKHIERSMEQWPSVDKILMWHENPTTGSSISTELWGVPVPADKQGNQETIKARIEYFTGLAKFIREKYPQLKMQYGNTGNSMQLLAEILRGHRFPREYLDMVGTEDLGQNIMTEKPIVNGLQSAWYLRDLVRKLGYEGVRSNACYEWMGRRDRALGTQKQAEWYTRDALHARAYGFETISLGLIHDATSGYYQTLWGGGGLCYRYPTMEPKPSYAAIATLTRVLDRAKFVRAVPTGSLTLYATEFRKGDDWVYALWVPRGERDITLRFDAPESSQLIDMYGREKPLSEAKFDLTVSSSPCYVVGKSPLKEVTPGASRFPDETPPTDATVVEPLEKLDRLTLQTTSDRRIDRHKDFENMPHRQMGKYQVREVNDPEKGPCIEFELEPDDTVWVGMQEYAFVRFNEPIEAQGSFDHVGIWVRGNGSWGDIRWEIQGQNGQTWFTEQTYMDWAANLALNFEGWNFLRWPLREGDNWRSKIKVTGLMVAIPPRTIYLTEATKVPNLKVRVKGLSLFTLDPKTSVRQIMSP